MLNLTSEKDERTGIGLKERTGIGLKEGCLYIWSRLDCCLNKFSISGVSVILGGGLREGISVGETWIK